MVHLQSAVDNGRLPGELSCAFGFAVVGAGLRKWVNNSFIFTQCSTNHFLNALILTNWFRKNMIKARQDRLLQNSTRKYFRPFIKPNNWLYSLYITVLFVRYSLPIYEHCLPANCRAQARPNDVYVLRGGRGLGQLKMTGVSFSRIPGPSGSQAGCSCASSANQCPMTLWGSMTSHGKCWWYGPWGSMVKIVSSIKARGRV